jgi:ribulose-phosphate 3-epimerase
LGEFGYDGDMGIEIIPAILPENLDDLQDHLVRVRDLAKTIQIDIVDGIFDPTRTWPYTDRASFERILSEEEGMPYWDEFDFEIDLMVSNSKDAALEWVRAGASRIIVHVESPDDRAALEALQEYREAEVMLQVGLAISLETPLSKLEDLAHMADSIQLMGIADIGLQGEPFDTRTLQRIREVRDMYPNHTISVDGGINATTGLACVQAGASRLVAGSFIWHGDAEENYKKLKSIVASL